MQQNFTTLGLKLKRHKLSYSYNEKDKALEIGKSLNKNKQLIMGIILLIITLVLLFVGGTLLSSVNPVIRKYILIVLIIPTGSFGIKMIWNFITLSKGNKGNKKFTKEAILIEKGKNTLEFPIHKISDIDFKIENNTNDIFEGNIFLIDLEGNKVNLLTLIDDDNKFLKNDLKFISDTIKEHIGK